MLRSTLPTESGKEAALPKMSGVVWRDVYWSLSYKTKDIKEAQEINQCEKSHRGFVLKTKPPGDSYLLRPEYLDAPGEKRRGC